MSANLYRTSSRSLNENFKLQVFLSHPADCKKICEIVRDYINTGIKNTLNRHGINIHAHMHEDKSPSLRAGGAHDASLKDVEQSVILFAFFDLVCPPYMDSC